MDHRWLFLPPVYIIYTLENTISIDSANSTEVFLSIDFLTQFHDFKLWTGSSGPKIFSCGHLELEWFFGATKKGIGWWVQKSHNVENTLSRVGEVTNLIGSLRTISKNGTWVKGRHGCMCFFNETTGYRMIFILAYKGQVVACSRKIRWFVLVNEAPKY